MTTLADRELAALRRMGETVTVEYSRYWRSSWEGPGKGHIPTAVRPVPNRGGWASYACGRIQGAPTETRSVLKHDLRFMPSICPRCLSALAHNAPCGPQEATQCVPRPEAGQGCHSDSNGA